MMDKTLNVLRKGQLCCHVESLLVQNDLILAIDEDILNLKDKQIVHFLLRELLNVRRNSEGDLVYLRLRLPALQIELGDTVFTALLFLSLSSLLLFLLLLQPQLPFLRALLPQTFDAIFAFLNLLSPPLSLDGVLFFLFHQLRVLWLVIFVFLRLINLMHHFVTIFDHIEVEAEIYRDGVGHSVALRKF